jgi:hypothetical protein
MNDSWGSDTPFAPPGRKEKKHNMLYMCSAFHGFRDGPPCGRAAPPAATPRDPVGAERDVRSPKFKVQSQKGKRWGGDPYRDTNHKPRATAGLARPCTLCPYRPGPPRRVFDGADCALATVRKPVGNGTAQPSPFVFVSSAPGGATETAFNRPPGAP